MVKIIEEHVGTVVEYAGHGIGSGLASMYVDTDDAGIIPIHGDWRMLMEISEMYPIGSRCKIALPDEGFDAWMVTGEDAELLA